MRRNAKAANSLYESCIFCDKFLESRNDPIDVWDNAPLDLNQLRHGGEELEHCGCDIFGARRIFLGSMIDRAEGYGS